VSHRADPRTPAAAVVSRYASRRAIEVTFSDAKNITGAGEARNRVPRGITSPGTIHQSCADGGRRPRGMPLKRGPPTPKVPRQPTPEEIRTVQLVWARLTAKLETVRGHR
jgi:hypothetical protein